MALATAITEERSPLPEGVTLTVEEITPEKANEYLSYNKDNRKPSKFWVRTLSQRLNDGEWLFTADPIRFDSDGYLRDGQHRLQMVVDSGITIVAPVARGLDPKVFFVLDTGKKRELDTVFHIMDYPYAPQLAATVKDTWSYLTNQRPNGVSHEQFVKFLDDHPELHHSVAFYQEKKKHPNVKLVGFPKPLTVAHYLLSRIDEEQADSFISGVMQGGDAITGTHLALRNTLIDWKRPDARKRKASDAAVLYVLIQVWNDLLAGKPDKEQIRVPSPEKLRKPRAIEPKGFPTSLFIKPTKQQAVLAALLDEEQEEDEE